VTTIHHLLRRAIAPSRHRAIAPSRHLLMLTRRTRTIAPSSYAYSHHRAIFLCLLTPHRHHRAIFLCLLTIRYTHRPNFDLDDPSSVQRYIDKMRGATMWGSGLEILMAHYLYCRPCSVFMESVRSAPLAVMNARGSRALALGFIATGSTGQHWNSAVAVRAGSGDAQDGSGPVAATDGKPVGLEKWLADLTP